MYAFVVADLCDYFFFFTITSVRGFASLCPQSGARTEDIGICWAANYWYDED